MANEVVLRRWATWLRANRHRQLRGRLRCEQADGAVHWCALGGLEEVRHTGSVFLFSTLLESECMTHVVRLNDAHGWTFPQIARWLELIADGALSLEEALRVRTPQELPGEGVLRPEP